MCIVICNKENKELNEKELWFWICNLPGIGQIKLTRLLEAFVSPRDIFTCRESDLIGIKGIKTNDCSTILNNRNIDNIRKQMQSMERKGISFISYAEPEYPKSLRNLYDPPYGLYVLGSLPDSSRKSIAVIGARNCSPYGREVARYFSSVLASAGIQIISGMARGIDSYGHEGALEAGGYTMAVLGSGIDYCYPKENIELYMKLEERGGVLSEFGPGILPKAGNFPLRNRIISGLCDGILVIEARDKSGSLITADQGLEQGKDIFAVPGRICDSLSAGTNQLIKYGAQLVASPEEILEYYNLSRDNKVQMIVDSSTIVSEEGKIVLDSLNLEPIHISSLSEQLKLDMGNLMKILLQLEMKKLINQPSKNYYCRVLC